MALLVHELQKDLQTASAQTENVCLSATTGGALGRSLSKMRTLIDRALAEVRVSAGAKARLRPINIAAFLGEVTASAAPNSIKQGCHFAATVPDNGLLINVDPELMSSTIGNLLQNAFKFTNCNADVRLRAHLVSDRILIEVENEPSIPPADAASTLPADFAPGIEDRSELGPDLQICRRRVELNNGILSVRSLPGRGRIFTIDLPRFIHPAPAG